jgi:hypothetical protein
MANEASCESSSSLVFTLVHRSGDTSSDDLPAPGSYELQVWPAEARNIATSETRSDDDLDPSPGRSKNPTRSVKKAMSRVPLLVRSSPAQGTGKLMFAKHKSLLFSSSLAQYTRATQHMAHQFMFATRANQLQGLMAASLFFHRVRRIPMSIN